MTPLKPIHIEENKEGIIEQQVCSSEEGIEIYMIKVGEKRNTMMRIY